MRIEQRVILERMKWLMVWRVVLVTFLLGFPLLLQLDFLKNTWSLFTFYFLIAATYFLTIVYIFFMKRVKNTALFTGLQLAIDLIFETALVMVSGGIESPFPFLSIITIVSGSIFFQQVGGVLTAAGATLCFGAMANVQYAQWAPALSVLTDKEFVYMLLLYMITFFTVGILSGRLSERLYKKEIDFLDLRIFHENIVQSIPSGLITTDLAGKMTSFNQAAEQMTGFRPEEAIGEIWWRLFSWEEIKSRYRDLVLAGVAQRFEGEIKNKRGERCLLGVTISILRNERGGQIGVIAIFQDLTQLKNLEMEMHKKDRLAIIGEMAAGMAHEIRNPLASISGSIQVLKRGLALDDENRGLMEIAENETERLNAIITQFLLYAKPLPPRRKWVDLHALLSETVQLLKNRPQEHVNVVLFIDAQPLMLFIDPEQIKQVFWNLSINAVEAMAHGGTLSIATRLVSSKKVSSDTQAGLVEISFKDTGEGIRKEDLPKIFYPFFTTKSSGSGLGLPIVQRVIEEHFGKVDVESGPTGASFLIYLPLEVSSGYGLASAEAVASGDKREPLTETPG